MFALFRLILLAIIALSIVLFLRLDLLKQFGISKTEKQPEVVVMESTAGEKSVPVEPPSTASSKPANEPVFEKLERTPVTHQNPIAETAAAPAPAPIEEPAALPAAEQTAGNSEPVAAETEVTGSVEAPAVDLPGSNPSSSEPIMAAEATENTEASLETAPAVDQKPAAMNENAVPGENTVVDQTTEAQVEALQPQVEAVPEMNVVEPESNPEPEVAAPSEQNTSAGETPSVDTVIDSETGDLENSLMEEIRETFDETKSSAAPATAPATTE